MEESHFGALRVRLLWTGEEIDQPQSQKVQVKSRIEIKGINARTVHVAGDRQRTSLLFLSEKYMMAKSTSREMLGWKKHRLESRLWGEISITLDMQMTPPLWQKVKKN